MSSPIFMLKRSPGFPGLCNRLPGYMHYTIFGKPDLLCRMLSGILDTLHAMPVSMRKAKPTPGMWMLCPGTRLVGMIPVMHRSLLSLVSWLRKTASPVLQRRKKALVIVLSLVTRQMLARRRSLALRQPSRSKCSSITPRSPRLLARTPVFQF